MIENVTHIDIALTCFLNPRRVFFLAVFVWNNLRNASENVIIFLQTENRRKPRGRRIISKRSTSLKEEQEGKWY